MKWINCEMESKIREILKTCYLPAGLGESKERACSIAAINIAMTGEVTDEVPECMSLQLGKWIIATQDTMLEDYRNCPKWKELLPWAAGTGRECENEIARIMINSIWRTLELITPVLQSLSLEDTWNKMLEERTYQSVNEMTIRVEQDLDRIGSSPETKASTLLDLLDTMLCDYSSLVRSIDKSYPSASADVAYTFAKVRRIWALYHECGAHDRLTPIFHVWDVYDPYQILLDCINITRDEQDGYISEVANKVEGQECYRESIPAYKATEETNKGCNC